LQQLAQPLQLKPLPRRKAILTKRIFEEMENVGHRKYLEKVNSQTLDDINEHVLELDVGSSGDNIVAFLLESEVIGLEYFFSSYSTEKLKEYADLCGLVVTSDSTVVLINSLITLSNYNKPKKTAKSKEKPRKTKPDLKKGVTAVDLVAHFNRDELVDFLKSKSISVAGNKRDLAQQIVAHLEGKPIPEKKTKKRKASKSPKKSTPTKRARTSSTSKSEKSEKSEKSSKGKKRQQKKIQQNI